MPSRRSSRAAPDADAVAHNFAAASALDETVFCACRPGPVPAADHTPATRIAPADVEAWCAFMRARGVRRVLSLLADDEVASYDVAPEAALAAGGLALTRVPVKSPGACARAMAALDDAKQAGEKIVVHCWGGGGRAGRCAAAWLVHAHGLSAVAAADEVNAAASRFGVNRRADAESLSKWMAAPIVAAAPAAAAAEPRPVDAPKNSGSAASASDCPRDAAEAAFATPAAPKADPSAISFFERYLTLWVALCMVIGALIGYYAPGVADALHQAQFAGINAVIAVLLWIMLFPMFATLDFTSLRAVGNAPGAILLTSVLNYRKYSDPSKLVKPFTMWGLGLLFMRVFYTKVIPDAALRDSYVAGLVLLAGAPCTAMVFVWSALMGGNSAFTLMQVAVNDVLMLALYVPICGLLIGASNIALPWDTIAVSVALFILAPLALATSVRVAVLHFRDEAYLLQRVVAPIKPLTTIALLATLILIFIFQGATLGTKTADIFLVAVPILIQSFALWGVCYAIAFYSCIPHERAGPASLIATSNFFELAVAVAISIYGPASGAALATVVGVLVEVPAMLFFVNVCNALKPVLDARCAACDDICPGYARAGDELLRVLLCGTVAPRAKPDTAKAPAAPAVEIVAPRVCGCGPSGCA